MIPSEREAAQDGGCSQCFGRHLCAYHEGYQDATDTLAVEYAVIPASRIGKSDAPLGIGAQASWLATMQRLYPRTKWVIAQRPVGPWTAVPEDTE